MSIADKYLEALEVNYKNWKLEPSIHQWTAPEHPERKVCIIKEITGPNVLCLLGLMLNVLYNEDRDEFRKQATDRMIQLLNGYSKTLGLKVWGDFPAGFDRCFDTGRDIIAFMGDIERHPGENELLRQWLKNFITGLYRENEYMEEMFK